MDEHRSPPMDVEAMVNVMGKPRSKVMDCHEVIKRCRDMKGWQSYRL